VNSFKECGLKVCIRIYPCFVHIKTNNFTGQSIWLSVSLSFVNRMWMKLVLDNLMAK